MADLNAKIVPLRTEVANRVPTGAQVDVGEIAVNLTDKKIYSKRSDGTVVQLGGGGLLDDIEDVSTSGAVTGQALVYDGSNWVPGTATGGGGADTSNVTLVASSLNSTTTFNAASVTVNLPSSLVAQEGDLMLLWVGLRASERSSDFTTTIPTPTGWTLLQSGTYITSSATNTDTSHALFSKTYAPGDSTVTLTTGAPTATDDWYTRVDTYRNAVVLDSTIVNTTTGGTTLSSSGYTSPSFVIPTGGAVASLAYNIYAFSGTGVITKYGTTTTGTLALTHVGPDNAEGKRIHSWFLTGVGTYTLKAVSGTGSTGSELPDGFHIAHVTLGNVPPAFDLESLDDVGYLVPDSQGLTGTWSATWSDNNYMTSIGRILTSAAGNYPAGYGSGIYITGSSQEGYDFSDIFDAIERDGGGRLTITRSTGTGPQTWVINRIVKLDSLEPGYFPETAANVSPIYYLELFGGFNGNGPEGQSNVMGIPAATNVYIARSKPGTEPDTGDVLTYQDDGTWGATPILLNGKPVELGTIANPDDVNTLTNQITCTYGSNANSYPSANTKTVNIYSTVTEFKFIFAYKGAKGVASAAGQRIYFFNPAATNPTVYNVLISSVQEYISYSYFYGISFTLDINDADTVLAKAYLTANPAAQLSFGSAVRTSVGQRVTVPAQDGDLLAYVEDDEAWKPVGARLNSDPLSWEGISLEGTPLVYFDGKIQPAKSVGEYPTHQGLISYGTTSYFRDNDIVNNTSNSSAGWTNTWTLISNGGDDSEETLAIPSWVKDINWEGVVTPSADMVLKYNHNGVFCLALPGTSIGRTYYSSGTVPNDCIFFYPWHQRDARTTAVYSLDKDDIFSIRAFLWTYYNNQDNGTIWYEINFYKASASVGIAVSDADVVSSTFTSWLNSDCGIFLPGVTNNLNGTLWSGYSNAPTQQGFTSYVFSRYPNGAIAMLNLGAGKLASLGDVVDTDPAEGQALTYDSLLKSWKPGNPTVGGLGRVTKPHTTASLAAGASEDATLSDVGRGGFIVSVSATAACWVVFYSSMAARTADLSRDRADDPSTGSGVLAEFVFGGGDTFVCTPSAGYFNNETPVQQEIYIRVTNTAGVSSSITVTATLSRTEP